MPLLFTSCEVGAKDVKKLSTIFFICVFGQQTYGQPLSATSIHWKKNQLKSKIDSMEEALEQKNQFHFQSGYANKVIFAGRNFGVNQFGATLGASYHHKSGINFEYNGNYWSGMPNRYALTEVGAYYEKPLSESFYLTSGYWRLSYNNGDEEERNVFTNFFMLDESWYTSVGLLNLSYYFIKGDESAHRLDATFSRSIDFYHFLHGDKVSIVPTFTATFATVNYLFFLSSLAELTTENENAFKAGNYEFALPVVYKKLGEFEINAAWHYAIPVAIVNEEQVHQVSYFTFEIIRTLLLKKLI